VIDAGPANWVEEKAGGPIIDASPDVCSHITGGSSCGWSDHFRITAHTTGEDDGREHGPFNPTTEEYIAIVGKEFYEREVKEGLYKPVVKAPLCCMSDQFQGYSFR
jgi:hypothetical protein